MNDKVSSSAENWEDGKLGLNKNTAQEVSAEEAAMIEAATGLNMQAISIRLQRPLLGVLKEIAKYRGVGYQPMIRDVLERWALGEIKTILQERALEVEKRQGELEQSESLSVGLRKHA